MARGSARRPQETPAFDDLRPPDAALAGDCVHCGFCLPTCPTYLLWGEEMDSPRGRIQLIEQGLSGAPMSHSMVGHWDACLGCLACETACPSGVQYGRLIEATRSQVERRHTRSTADRTLRALIFALFPHPARLRALRGPLRVAQRLGAHRASVRILERPAPRLAAMAALTPAMKPRHEIPAHTPAVGERRATVSLLTGCIQREFFSGVNAATARVLAAEGCDVVIPAGQGCCGALSVHNGRELEARAYARRIIDTFASAGGDAIVVNAAGCGSAMKEYGYLLADDPRYAGRAQEFSSKVRDVSEFISEIGPTAIRHPVERTIAYHDACHLAHGQGIRAQPRELLLGVPGIVVRELPEPDICCGSAGIYNILNPEPAGELGRRKASSVLATGADCLVTANPGCLMQIAAALRRMGAEMELAHPIEILDRSINPAR